MSINGTLTFTLECQITAILFGGLTIPLQPQTIPPFSVR